MSKSESRPRLTAARKFELYLATRSTDAPLGEILRQYSVHLDDLRAIEHTVESSALAGLKAQSRHGRPSTDLSPARVQQLEQELAEKTHGLFGILRERATYRGAPLTQTGDTLPDPSTAAGRAL